ncbi:apolipoprotein C-II [Genypterus blacodes]|uniref:apolipoprotein C-II n=1 Tax=Genypterus blacodes TaxID=154954 RepID=UPI003F75C395
MNKLLIITVLVAVLAFSAESSRLPRQTEEEAVEAVEEKQDQAGTVTRFTDTIKSYYGSAVDTASDYMGRMKGLKLEEKAKNAYDETTKVVGTYFSIMQDQLYHVFSQQ